MDHPADQKCTNSEVSCGRDGVDKCISQRTSQELHSSTSLDAAQSRSGHSARTLKVTLLANEWGSFKGGLSTIDRTLAILLAKHSKVNATLLVPQFVCSEEDKRIAQSHNISIREAQCRPGFSDPLDWLRFPPRDLTIDIVIGHGAKLGKQAQVIRESHHCKWVQVVHTVPEELAMHKNYLRAIAKGEEKNRAEVDLCKLADLVVAVGPKVAQAFSSCLRSSHQDVFQLTPDIFADFADVKHSVQEVAKFEVLMFGRGDSEDLSLKGYDIAASAIVELKDSSYRLIFVGAPDGKQDAVAETLLKTGISKNQLIVRSYAQNKERLKELFSEVNLAIMPSRMEGFSLTALEAISAGLPILVKGNSGFGEALGGLPSGMTFLIESDDPKDWAKAIAALRHKPRTQRIQEIQTLQRSYEEAYNWETQCKSLVERMWKTVYGVEKPTKHKSPVKSCTGDDTAGQTASDTHLPQGRSRFCGECDEILTKFHKFWQCTNDHTTCDNCAVDHWWDANSYTCTHQDCKEPLHLVHPSDTTRELVCVFVDTNNLAEEDKVALDIRKVIDTVANNREVAMVTLYGSDAPSSSDSVLDKESECEWTIIRETYAKTYLVTDIVKVVSDKSLKKGKIVIVNGDPYMIPAIEKGLSKNWPFEIYMCNNRIPIELEELQHENASMLKIFSLESVAQSVTSPSYAEDAKRVKIGLNVQPDVL